MAIARVDPHEEVAVKKVLSLKRQLSSGSPNRGVVEEMSLRVDEDVVGAALSLGVEAHAPVPLLRLWLLSRLTVSHLSDFSSSVMIFSTMER